MKIDITEDQINKLLEDVKQEFAELQKSEEAQLAKADEESKKEEKSEKDDSSEKKEGSEQSMAKDFPPEEKKEEAPAEVAPEAPASEADPAAEGGEVSPDQLFDMYGKLSDEDLSMHYMACSKALFGRMDAPAEEEMPPAAPEAPAPSPEPAPAPEVAKSNKVADEMLEAFKTMEGENKVLKDESDALKKKVDELTETLGKLVAKPAKSGFTSGTVIENAPQAPKTLTKSQVLSALAKKAAEPNLSHEDQGKIVKFSLNPVFTEELSKFLEEKQK